MTFNTVVEAQKAGLVPFSKFLDYFEDNIKYVLNTRSQIMNDPTRKTMIVRRKDGRIALYIDSQTKKGTPKASKSGKYMSIRHLAETLFSSSPDLSLSAFKAGMKEEYPDSAPSGDKCYGHWCWYRSKLVVQGQFRCVPKPEWVQKRKK